MSAEETFRALIALAREAGTPSGAAARALLRRHLESLAYDVREQPFAFQSASLLVLPLLGAGLGWLALLEVPLLMLGRLPRFLAAGIWITGVIALATLAWGLGVGVEVPGAERRADSNLIATRPGKPVRRWIVAHLDTKAQGHSMAGRLVAVWVLVLAALGLSVLIVLRAVGGPPSGTLIAIGSGLAVTAGFLAGRGRLQGTSGGARDNGTGVLAALVAAEARPADDVGFLFTGAEEFGLVGARAFVKAGLATGADVVNLDTITDRGRLYVIVHDGAASPLASRLGVALAGLPAEIRIRHLPLGMLVDSLPFARAGLCALTVGRLDWQDLRRLHTGRDTIEGLGLETAMAVGRVVARLR